MEVDIGILLRRFRAVSFKGSKATLMDLVSVEWEVGIKFPENYRELLTQFEGSVIFNEGVIYRPLEASRSEGNDGCNSLEMLFGITGPHGLLPAYKRYKKRLPKELIAIGEVTGGDLICISKENYSIILWRHEALSSNDATYKVSHCIDDFFSALNAESDETSNMVSKIDRSRSSIRIKPPEQK